MSAGLYDVTGGEDICDCTRETLQIGFSSCYNLGVMSGVQPFQFEPTFPPGGEPTDSEESEEDDTEVNLSARIGNTEWCSCGRNCVAMLTDHESFCCQELEELNQKFDESG